MSSDPRDHDLDSTQEAQRPEEAQRPPEYASKGTSRSTRKSDRGRSDRRDVIAEELVPHAYTEAERQEIAASIKPITRAQIDEEMTRLMCVSDKQFAKRCLLGNKIVDYFTYAQRLDTRGKYNASFYDFAYNIEVFKRKHCVQNMLRFYAEDRNKDGRMSEMYVLKETYNICISAINIMRPMTCLEYFRRYNSRRILNFCAGWGGSAVAAAAHRAEHYYGVDLNSQLVAPYRRLTDFLAEHSPTRVELLAGTNCLDVAYHDWVYDTVFVSPPYYNVEDYPDAIPYETKEQMHAEFYRPAFARTYAALQPGGVYIVNVWECIFDECLLPLLGAPTVTDAMGKASRQNGYVERVYIWRKPTDATFDVPVFDASAVPAKPIGAGRNRFTKRTPRSAPSDDPPSS